MNNALMLLFSVSAFIYLLIKEDDNPVYELGLVVFGFLSFLFLTGLLFS